MKPTMKEAIREAAPAHCFSTDDGATLDVRWRDYEERTLPMLAELQSKGLAEVVEVELAAEPETTWPENTWQRILKACGEPEED